MSDEPLTVCPKCKGKLTKILYPTGVIFKGSGFYTTDYKGSGKEPAKSNGTSSGGSESKPGSETKPETKGDSKGDAKTESKPDSTD
jgi:predicted nucleic acid-binding Zn ribbon protein